MKGLKVKLAKPPKGYSCWLEWAVAEAHSGGLDISPTDATEKNCEKELEVFRKYLEVLDVYH